ncbi:MAG: MerR family transcriptional regulator, heat shock protein HspR [Solirubrobacterales bacterium]|nr:MerR family transcriptional regulator, heat shock protein HspR [Solirubrobacterales bacterium]
MAEERKPQRVVRSRTTATFDEGRGVFMISVAAELAEMHPQTLRMYEARGLISPQRSPKNTRLYSYSDVERLRRIQRMTAQEGLNLAGVETVLELEAQLERTREELAKMRRRSVELERRMLDEIERVKRSLRAEIVPYGAYEPPDMKPPTEAGPVRIPVERPDEGS